MVNWDLTLEIYAFQHKINQQLEDNISQLENETEGYANEGKLDPRIKARMNKELDDIIEKIKELEKFSRINFTGFMKVNSRLMDGLIVDCQEA